MTPNSLSPDAVRQQLQQDTQACETLIMLLQHEQNALTARDPVQLEDLIHKKTLELNQLEQNAKLRGQWMRQRSSAESTALEGAWRNLLSQIDPKLDLQWLNFKDLLKQCQLQNQINGKLVARSQQVTNRILAVVRGQYENSPTYGPNGGHNTTSTAHKLGEA